MKKVGKIIGNVLIVLVLIFSILMTVLVISSSKSESTLPNLFGKAILSVQSDSMLSEQGFDKGALIIVDIHDKEEDKDVVYKVGDVVTFWRIETTTGERYLETHRIVENDPVKNGIANYKNEIKDGVWIHGGQPQYITRGDNPISCPDIDRDAANNPEYLVNDNVVAVWTGTAIPGLGAVMDFLRSQLGFMLCVVVPTAVFFLFELFKFITVLMENKKEKALEAVKNAEDEIKQKVIAEMLAKQEAEKSQNVTAEKVADIDEEIKKKAIEEYLAKQAAAKTDDEKTD